jgi:hypothetical protein
MTTNRGAPELVSLVTTQNAASACSTLGVQHSGKAVRIARQLEPL